MKNTIYAVLALGWIPTLAIATGIAQSKPPTALAPGRTPIKVTRLYTGADGKTKVEEFEIPLKAQGRGTELSIGILRRQGNSW